MPTAHICPLCGNQLARARAVLDAVYQLPIVRCDCGHTTVRRRHPVTVRARRAVLIAGAIVRLAFQLLFAIGFSAAVAGCIHVFANQIRDLRLTPLSFIKTLFVQSKEHDRLMRNWFIGDNGLWLLAAFLSASFIAGIWLRIGLSHWRWPRQLMGWIILISALIWLDLFFWPLTWMIRKLTSEPTRYDGPTLSQSIDFGAILFVSVFITLLGTPIGFVLTRVSAHSSRRRFIKRLAKLRRRRRAE